MDTETLLRIAVTEDPDVRASVDAATLEAVIPVPAAHEEGYDPLVSAARIYRAETPADYVAAVHEHIDKFDGLETSDVTEESVSAVLPQEEEPA